MPLSSHSGQPAAARQRSIDDPRNFTPPNRQASAVPTSSTAVHRFPLYPGILAHFLPEAHAPSRSTTSPKISCDSVQSTPQAHVPRSTEAHLLPPIHRTKEHRPEDTPLSPPASSHHAYHFRRQVQALRSPRSKVRMPLLLVPPPSPLRPRPSSRPTVVLTNFFAPKTDSRPRNSRISASNSASS
jgi:hypothetical protein